MKCSKCGLENRDKARYCRKCGAELMSKSSAIQEDNIIGRKEIISKLKVVINTLIINKRRELSGFEPEMKNQTFLLKGKPGTGKSTVTTWFINELIKNQLLSSIPEFLDAKKLKQEYGDEYTLSNFLHQTSDKVIVIKDVHLELDYVAELFRALSKNKLGKICICIGLDEKLNDFFKNNPDVKQRIDYTFQFESYTDCEIKDILKSRIIQKGYFFSGDDNDIDELLLHYVIEGNKNPNKEHVNGYLAEELWIKINETFSSRIKTQTHPNYQVLLPMDIPVQSARKSEKEIFNELDSLIGLKDVKKQIRQLWISVKMTLERRKKGIQAELPIIHIVFTGNPGTGKTTVARILGQLFYSIGLLPSSNVIETSRKDLIGQYVGQTAPLVNEVCDKAIGGILFIDEAYSIINGNNDFFGQEAIDTLLKRMEDDRGKFIVIAAGYPKEMKKFLESNPGLDSRFNTTLRFLDYSPEELLQIFTQYSSRNGFAITKEAMVRVNVAVKKMYAAKTKDFANAREIRNFFDKTKRDFDSRIAALPEEQRIKNVLQTIEAIDIPEVA